MKKTLQRYDYLDLLKVIAMLMVVSLHTGLWHTNFLVTQSSRSFIQFCIRLICEGVQIFVLVNGFLLINKEFDIKKHIKKIFKILFLIIFWSLVPYIILNIICNRNITFENIINNTLTVNINNYYNGPLWFLQNLLMLYFIYPIINYIFKNNKKIYYYLFYAVVFFTFIGTFLTSINDLNIIKDTYINNLIIFISNFNPIKNGVFIFYFMLGGILFDKREIFDIKKNRIIFMLIGLLSYIVSILFTVYIFKYRNASFCDYYLYGRIPLIFIILGIFALVYKYKDKGKFHNRIVKSIGTNTLGIYLIHVPIRNILFYYNILSVSNLLNRIITYFALFVISYLLTLLIKKIPYVKKIITI